MVHKSKIQSLLQNLMDTGHLSDMLIRDRKASLQRPINKRSSDRSGKAEEEVDIGYESSWSGIFTSTRG